MSGDFTWASSSTQATLTVSPTKQPQEVGYYVVRFQVCLTNYPTRCAFKDSSVMITDCVVTSVQVVDLGSNILSSETFLLNGVSFSKSLEAKQTPNCGYASSGWTALSTGANTGHQDKFEVFTDASAGVLGWSGMTQGNRAGTYNVAITSVTVKGVTYNSASLVSPSSFVLTVSTGCAATVVTASSVSNISLKVWDASAYYPSTGVAYADFTDTVSATVGDPTLCEKTYTATITGPSSLTVFSLDTTNSQFQIYSDALSQIGTYTVTLKGTVTTEPTKFATTTFTIAIVDPCLTTTLIQPTPALSDMSTSVSVASGPVTQQVGVFKDQVSVSYGDSTGTQYCSARQYSISTAISTLATAVLDSLSLSIDANTGLISVQSSNSGHIGTHTATVSVKLSSYTSIISTLAPFTITILSCAVTSIQVVQNSDMGNLVAQTYTLSSTLTLSYSLSVKQIPSCGYAGSGWAVTATGPEPANFNTIGAATGTYIIAPTTTTSQAGTYTIQVTAVTVNGITYGTSPSLVAPSSFTLTVVNPCSTTTVTSTSVNAISLVVWDIEKLYPASIAAFTDFTDSISTLNSNPMMCTKSYSATVSTNAGGQSLTNFELDTGLKQFKVSSQQYNQIGTYTVTLKGQITDFPGQFATSTFTITVVDPCLTTTLIQPTPAISDMSTSVLVQISPGGSPLYVNQQVGIFKDQVSVTHGDASGTQYCGARQYSISSTTAASSLTTAELFIGSSSGLIQVYTAMNAAIGIHTVTITVNLASYPTIESTLADFTIEIIGCVITEFSMVNLSPINDQTYTISDPAHPWSLVGSSVTTQVPPCGYSEMGSSAITPSFVTATSGTTLNYSAYTRDLAFVGINSITITSTLTGYNFSPARAAPECSSTFLLTTLDPCLLSVISIVPIQIENLVAFAGYNVTSLSKYTYNDTESLSRTFVTDPSDFCGEKLLNFSINNTATSTLKATNNDQIYFSTPANTTSFGVGLATVVATMKNYPTIQSVPLSFMVTILGCEPPTVADQEYIQGSSPLVITFDKFRVLPDGYDAGPSTVEAYIFTGSELPAQIDLTCDCLTKISSLGWIQFDATASQLVISASSNQYVGKYQIVLVKSFGDFTGVNPYTHFILTVQPLNVNVTPVLKRSPFFKTILEPQKVTQQCPGPNIRLWFFDLPEYIDPNNSPVTVSVQLKRDFFDFDNSTMRITQRKSIEKSVNQTINITLQNDLKMKATYFLPVQFVCEVKLAPFNFTMQEERDRITKQGKWPQAYIQEIEPSGLMHVKFKQKMKIPEHPELIQNETITLDDEIYPILRLTVIPGNFSDPQMLVFNWTFVEFKETELLIQLDFNHTTYVSSNSKYPDQIQLTIYGYQLFSDIFANFMLPPTVLKPKILPSIATKNEAAAAYSIVETTKVTLQSTMLINTIVSILISGPLQQLLASVKHLQIIVHITLINVAYPATATLFMGMLMNVLTFQFYNFSDFYNKVFSLDPDSVGSNPLNNQFNMLGYNALYIIQNFGTLCWTIFVAPVGWALAPMVVQFCKGEFAYLKTRFNRMMFYNYWIGFVNEAYLFLAVCAGLNLFYFRWNTYGDAINSFLALFCGSVLIIFPAFVGIFYRKQSNFDQILKRNEEFLSRFGNAIVGLNFKRKGKLALIHTCASIVRKLLLAYIVVFQQNQPTFSIFVVNFQAIVMMMTSGLTEPMTEKVSNTMDLVNEAFVLLTTYHLYQFTEFMTHLDKRSIVGRSLMLLIIINVALNIAVVVIQTSVLGIRKLKLKFMKHKQAKRIKKQLERKLDKQYWSAVRNKIRLKDAQVARRAERARLAQLEENRLGQVDQLVRTRQQLPDADIENQL